MGSFTELSLAFTFAADTPIEIVEQRLLSGDSLHRAALDSVHRAMDAHHANAPKGGP